MHLVSHLRRSESRWIGKGNTSLTCSSDITNKHKLKNSGGNPTSPLNIRCSMSSPSEIFRSSFRAVSRAWSSCSFAAVTADFSARRDRRVRLVFWKVSRMTLSTAFIETSSAFPSSRAGVRNALIVLFSKFDSTNDDRGNAIPQDSSRRMFSTIPMKGLMDLTTHRQLSLQERILNFLTTDSANTKFKGCLWIDRI